MTVPFIPGPWETYRRGPWDNHSIILGGEHLEGLGSELLMDIYVTDVAKKAATVRLIKYAPALYQMLQTLCDTSCDAYVTALEMGGLWDTAEGLLRQIDGNKTPAAQTAGEQEDD